MALIAEKEIVNPFDLPEYAEYYSSGIMGSVDNGDPSSWRTNEIKKLIEPGNGAILDIGCALEDLFINLGNWGYEKPYCGVDCNRAMAKKAKELGRPAILWGTLPKIQLKNKCADDVVCFGVLPYLKFDIKNILELLRLAKKTVSFDIGSVDSEEDFNIVKYTPKSGVEYSYNLPSRKYIGKIIYSLGGRPSVAYELFPESGLSCENKKVILEFVKITL